MCAALPAQGYILLLLRSDASLLGLKYLTILIYTFLNPPIRHRYEEKDHAGQVVGAPQSAAARIYTGRFISIGAHLSLSGCPHFAHSRPYWWTGRLQFVAPSTPCQLVLSVSGMVYLPLSLPLRARAHVLAPCTSNMRVHHALHARNPAHVCSNADFEKGGLTMHIRSHCHAMRLMSLRWAHRCVV